MFHLKWTSALPNVKNNHLKHSSIPAAGQGHVAEDRCYASHRTPCTSRSSLRGSHSPLQTAHRQTDYNNCNNWLWTRSLMFHLWQSDEGFQFTHYTQNESWAHPTMPYIWLLSSFQPCTHTNRINSNLQWPDVAQLTSMPVSGQKSITPTLLTYLNTSETIYTGLCLVMSPCTLWSGYKHFRGHICMHAHADARARAHTHTHTHTQMKTCNFQIRPSVLLDNYVSWCSIPTVYSPSQQPSLSLNGWG